MNEKNDDATPATVETDQFTQYKKDPRLDPLVYKNPVAQTGVAHIFDSDLVQAVLATNDEEDFFNLIRRHKRDHYQEIINKYESKPLENRETILTHTAKVAVDIVAAAYAFAKRALEKSYGLPACLSSYKQILPSVLAIVCMGKMGSKGINYDSDLDMIFIYSARGETTGGNKKIDNSEFFVKLTQRLINSLSLMTALDRCYKIDTELRPSGNTGALVTSYDHFLDHQMNRAQNWERLALLRALPLSEDAVFANQIRSEIQKLCFDRALASNFFNEMHTIRQRVITEKCHESASLIDIKLGPGALMDIEFILFGISLKYGKMFPQLARNNLFEILHQLNSHHILTSAEIQIMTAAHLYYRTIPALYYVTQRRSQNVIDFASTSFAQVAERLGFTNTVELKDKILHFRSEIKNIYQKFYHPRNGSSTDVSRLSF